MTPGPWRGREGLETSSRRRGGWGMSWRCHPSHRASRLRYTRGRRKVRLVVRALAAALALPVRYLPAVRARPAVGVRTAVAGSTVPGVLAPAGALLVPGTPARSVPVPLRVLSLGVVALAVVVVAAVVS